MRRPSPARAASLLDAVEDARKTLEDARHTYEKAIVHAVNQGVVQERVAERALLTRSRVGQLTLRAQRGRS